MSKQSKTCTNCEGTGNTFLRDDGPAVGDCLNCEGTGLLDAGEVHDQDIADKLDDIITKIDTVKEKVDEIKAVVDLL